MILPIMFVFFGSGQQTVFITQSSSLFAGWYSIQCWLGMHLVSLLERVSCDSGAKACLHFGLLQAFMKVHFCFVTPLAEWDWWTLIDNFDWHFLFCLSPHFWQCNSKNLCEFKVVVHEHWPKHHIIVFCFCVPWLIFGISIFSIFCHNFSAMDMWPKCESGNRCWLPSQESISQSHRMMWWRLSIQWHQCVGWHFVDGTPSNDVHGSLTGSNIRKIA